MCEVDENECEFSFCYGIVICVDEVGRFSCVCLLGMEGFFCEVNIDDCVMLLCVVGLICVDEFDFFSCVC